MSQFEFRWIQNIFKSLEFRKSEKNWVNITVCTLIEKLHFYSDSKRPKTNEWIMDYRKNLEEIIIIEKNGEHLTVCSELYELEHIPFSCSNLLS